jgi:hypothetical protein
VEAVMGKLIFSCHITFIKGRNIIGGVMWLYEILHEARRKNSKG